jgi:hypothetical protein
MQQETRERLLEAIVSCAPRGAKAEDEPEDMLDFLPLPAHAKALESHVLVVLGGRGTGKTRLFRALIGGNAQTIASVGRARSIPHLDSSSFVVGFDQSKEFPEDQVVAQKLAGSDSLQLRAFWSGLLVAMLLRNKDTRNQLKQQLGDLADAFEEPRQISVWLPVAKDEAESLSLALDDLDDFLIEREMWIIVTYDALDRVTVEYPSLRPLIRELLAYWLTQWKRRDRIIPKIFLRTDLFDEEFLAFPDGSKLKGGNTLQLTWDPEWLYRLLFKRMANSSDELHLYLSQECSLRFEGDSVLGRMPEEDRAAYERVIEKMVGKYMGSHPTKGLSYNWMPNHIQDANGHGTPRSILKLFTKAAEEELASPQRKTELLIRPSSLQGALMATSQERLLELKEEYPWIAQLETALRDKQVPMASKNLITILSRIEWSDRNPMPSRSFDGLVETLLRLGILRRTSDGRIHVPDIYLYGFDLKRKGGVKRPARARA